MIYSILFIHIYIYNCLYIIIYIYVYTCITGLSISIAMGETLGQALASWSRGPFHRPRRTMTTTISNGAMGPNGDERWGSHSYEDFGFIRRRCSMYGIFTYIWAMFGVNVGKYSIHGAYGRDTMSTPVFAKPWFMKNGSRFSCNSHFI